MVVRATLATTLFLNVITAPSTTAHASDCGDLERYAKDVYTKLRELGRQAGCTMPIPGRGEFRPCFLGARVFTGIASGLIGWWNNVAKNGWATLGPRTLGVDPESGTLIARLGFERTFLTSFPVQTESASIEVKKQDGSAETDVIICKLDESGKSTKVATYTFPNENKARTKKFDIKGADGALLAVRLNNKSVTNAFKYRIAARYLPERNTLPAVKGAADLHVHMTMHMGMGGSWLWGDFSKPLGACDSNHAVRLLAPKGAKILHGEPGKDWPHFLDTAHQQAHGDALHEAFRNGLKLVVLAPVNNELLCNAMKVAYPSRTVCDDMAAVAAQIDAIHDFAKANSDWFEVAVTPWHARKIIHARKLAAVISIEASHVLPRGQGDFTTQLDRFFFSGMRAFQLAHESDSNLAGAAYHHGLLAQFQNLLKYPGIETFLGLFRKENKKGLTDRGRQVVAALVKRRMLIDAMHISKRSLKDLYDELRSKHRWYPMFSSHTRFEKTLPRDRLEMQGELLTSDEQVDWHRKTGGMAGLRTGPEAAMEVADKDGRGKYPDWCPGSATSLAQSVIYARKKGLSLAFGTDINGFVTLTGPRFGAERCPAVADRARIPAERLALSRNGVFRDYATRGLSSIAALPALLGDLKVLSGDKEKGTPSARKLLADGVRGLENSAETFIKMWERAWDSSRREIK